MSKKVRTILSSESGENSIDTNDVPTPVMTESSRLWNVAAMALSRKLLEAARIKRRCGDVLDAKGSEEAFHASRELHQLAVILHNVPGLAEETTATIKRACIDRIVEMHRTSDQMLTLTKFIKNNK